MAVRKEYRMGKRLMVFRNIFVLMASALLFCFYFIYDYLFGAAYPWIKGAPLVAIFLLLEAAVIALGRWWCQRLTDKTLYTVTDEALEIQLGDSHRTLKWKDFQKAYYGTVDFAGSCPVTYQVKGERFQPSPYLGDVWKMNMEIVEHIEPYAEIEEGLKTKISAFS